MTTLRFYARLQNPEEEGLSSTTAHHIHAVLHGALDMAERHGLIPRNPADLVDAPRFAETEMNVLDPQQARAFLRAIEGDRLEALYLLAIMTGMRQGELLGLHWKDIDFAHHTLQVNTTLSYSSGTGFKLGTPKTRRSRRRVDLPPQTEQALLKHREAQAAERAAKGRLWSSDWPDLVFTNENGGPIRGQVLALWSFNRILDRAGLPRIRFHDLRHTLATLMLVNGESGKVVSERLGHASVRTTLDRYSHILPGMQREAAKRLEDLLLRQPNGEPPTT